MTTRTQARGTRHPRDAGCLFLFVDQVLAVIDPLDRRSTVSFRQACMKWHEIYGIVAGCSITNFGRTADGCQDNTRASGSAAAGSGAV